MSLKIPKLDKTEEVEFDGMKGTLKAYRIVDNEYLIPIRKSMHDVAVLVRKSDLLDKKIGPDKDENNYTIEETEQVQNIWKEIEGLKGEMQEYQWGLAQRGLKRAFFDTEDKRDAGELDLIPDLEIPTSYAVTIANLMMDFGEAFINEEPEEADKGKPKKGKKAPKKKSKK